MTLGREQAQRFYDRFGARQDRQGWYEDPAIDLLIDRADFASSRSVVELGCGTGRLACRLFEEQLPSTATYRGYDSSATMVALARQRLAPWADRARIDRTAGDPRLPVEDGGADRFLSTWVLDLLSEGDIALALDEAARILRPGGRLCLAGLTRGRGPISGLVSALWSTVHRIRPALVGGCRPLETAKCLDRECWRLLHHGVVTPWGIASEVLIAERLGARAMSPSQA